VLGCVRRNESKGERDSSLLALQDHQRRPSDRHRSKPDKVLSTAGVVRKLLLSCIESTRMVISLKWQSRIHWDLLRAEGTRTVIGLVLHRSLRIEV
jgi:hypothetical protein